jgi:hypothetical protein
MSKRLRYQMIKSSVQRLQSQRRQSVQKIELNREIEKIEGEDPICSVKKYSKSM